MKKFVTVRIFFGLCFCTYLTIARSKIDGRIIGGSPANITDYPYMLSFEILGQPVCGASIIDESWAVTAAHCVEDVSPGVVKLRAGTSSRGTGGSLHSVTRIIIHPEYGNFFVDYDIAILKVSPHFILSESVQPIAPAIAVPTPGTVVVVTGWGVTTVGNYTSYPTQLHRVQVPIVSSDICSEAYSIVGITPRMICAAAPEGGKDACQNDSGGPLAASRQLVGIVSWGRGCGEKGYPGVYTNVAILTPWINNVTQTSYSEHKIFAR